MRLDWWNIGQTCFVSVDDTTITLVRIGSELFQESNGDFVPLNVLHVEQTPGAACDLGIIRFEAEVCGNTLGGTMICTSRVVKVHYEGHAPELCHVALTSEKTKALLPTVQYA